MAVAFDAAVESHTGTTGSASEASFTFSLNPVGTPKGIGVFVFNLSSTANKVTSITYDGASVPAIGAAVAIDTLTEPGRTALFYLGTSVPTTDPASIIVNRVNDTAILYAVGFTVTALTDTEVYTAGIVLLQEDQALAEQSVTDGSPGTNSVRFAGVMSGLNTQPGAGANSTLLFGIDVGGNGAQVVRETTAGQGARSVGFSGASDDVAAVHFAIREVVAGGSNPRRLTNQIPLSSLVGGFLARMRRAGNLPLAFPNGRF